MIKIIDKIQYHFIKKIYGDHNSSRRVIKALTKIIKEMPEDGLGLNIGAGLTYIDPRIKSLDIEKGENIDFVGKAESIPLSDESLDLVICQEVLEHIQEPWKAMKEITRVLKPEGRLYLQVPFIIGFHPCPNDYWRFTSEGIKQVVLESQFVILESGESVGSATGFYRITVEFFSILFSIILPFMYKPFKALFALLFYPVKWLDPLLFISKESYRISGGYYVICAKKT